MASKTCAAFERLSAILDTLRRDCPWDRRQTLRSLRYLTLEETHELSEAILDNSPNDIKKELGDLAMHILFYAKIAEDEGLFSVADVYNAISDKLISRHPFIYDKENYHGENWEQLKMKEGRRDVLEGVPSTLPTLVKALRVQEKLAGHTDNALPPSEMSEEEYGQQLYDLVDWGRRHGLNADDALEKAIRHNAEIHHGNG